MERKTVSTSTESWISIHAISGDAAIYSALPQIAVKAIDRYQHGGAGYSLIISSRGAAGLQLQIEKPIPASMATQAQKDLRDKIMSDNKEIRKSNTLVENEASQCAGWILTQFDEPSRTLIMNNSDWSTQAGPDNRGVQRNGKIDLQRFIAFVWHIKTTLQGDGSEKLTTMKVLDETCLASNADPNNFEAQYGKNLTEALRAGNVLDESSLFRTSHFAKRARIDPKDWTGFLSQYGNNLPPRGLGHTDVMAYIRRTREREALVSATSSKSIKSAANAMTSANNSAIETANMSQTASGPPCAVCAGLKTVLPEVFHDRRIMSHTSDTCSVALALKDPKNKELIAAPKREREGKAPNSPIRSNKRRRGRGGNAAAMLADDGKQGDPDGLD
jgi:hypothetical protein